MTISESPLTAFLPDSGDACVTDQQPSGRLQAASSFPPDSQPSYDSPAFSPAQECRSKPYYSAGEDFGSNSIRERNEVEVESAERACDSAARDENSSVCQLVRALLLQSGYPLAKIACHCFDQSLSLSGCVTQYYHLQVALEIAKQTAGGRQLDIQIQVRPQASPATTSRSPQP